MKKFYLLIALLLILAGCGPVRHYYRTDARRTYSFQEQLDRRSYRLVVERETVRNGRAASRTGRYSSVDIPDFVITVNGDRLHNSREGYIDYSISKYRDSRHSQYRTIRFSNYYRHGYSLEGKYELTVYPNGYFRLVVRGRNDAVRHEYEGQMEHGYDGLYRYPRR